MTWFRLSNIPIRRISKYSILKAEEFIVQTETEMDEVKKSPGQCHSL